MLISSLKEAVRMNFDESKYTEQKRALAYVAKMSKKCNSFDMTVTPDTHTWLKRTLKGICYVSDNITVLNDGLVHCVVARDEDAFMRHEKRR